MEATGSVIKDYYIGNTRVRICDDYCRAKTEREIKDILKRIARNAIEPISVATCKKDNERNT